MDTMQDLLTLYESIGGAETVASVVDEFYQRVMEDRELARYFEGVDMAALMSHQRAFLTAAFHGPDTYTGRPLREAHAGLGITHDQFDRLTQALLETLRGIGAEDAHIRLLDSTLANLRSQVVEKP
jgi:hemoglobin